MHHWLQSALLCEAPYGAALGDIQGGITTTKIWQQTKEWQQQGLELAWNNISRKNPQSWVLNYLSWLIQEMATGKRSVSFWKGPEPPCCYGLVGIFLSRHSVPHILWTFTQASLCFRIFTGTVSCHCNFFPPFCAIWRLFCAFFKKCLPFLEFVCNFYRLRAISWGNYTNGWGLLPFEDVCIRGWITLHWILVVEYKFFTFWMFMDKHLGYLKAGMGLI